MEKAIRQTTYTSKIGDTTLIIKSSYTGTKTLADAFEEIIVSAYRKKHSCLDSGSDPVTIQPRTASS